MNDEIAYLKTLFEGNTLLRNNSEGILKKGRDILKQKCIKRANTASATLCNIVRRDYAQFISVLHGSWFGLLHIIFTKKKVMHYDMHMIYINTKNNIFVHTSSFVK